MEYAARYVMIKGVKKKRYPVVHTLANWAHALVSITKYALPLHGMVLLPLIADLHMFRVPDMSSKKSYL